MFVQALTLPSIAGLEERLVRVQAGAVVIDSIASLVRKEFDVQSGRERSDYLASEAIALKYAWPI